jgi:hypothetical protein
MATKGAIAAGKEQAIKRLAAAMTTLSERLGVEPIDLTKRHRDPAYGQMVQLEALAGWSEQIVTALDKASEPPDEETEPDDNPGDDVPPLEVEPPVIQVDHAEPVTSTVEIISDVNDEPADPPAESGKSKRKGQ